MNFDEKSRYDRIFQQVTHKVGDSEINISIDFKIHRLCQFY